MEMLLKLIFCIMIGAISIWRVRKICRRNKLREIAHDVIGRWESCFPHQLSTRWLRHEVNLSVMERGLKLPKMTEELAEEIFLTLCKHGVLQRHERQHVNGTCSSFYTLIPAADRR